MSIAKSASEIDNFLKAPLGNVSAANARSLQNIAHGVVSNIRKYVNADTIQHKLGTQTIKVDGDFGLCAPHMVSFCHAYAEVSQGLIGIDKLLSKGEPRAEGGVPADAATTKDHRSGICEALIRSTVHLRALALATKQLGELLKEWLPIENTEVSNVLPAIHEGCLKLQASAKESFFAHVNSFLTGARTTCALDLGTFEGLEKEFQALDAQTNVVTQAHCDSLFPATNTPEAKRFVAGVLWLSENFEKVRTEVKNMNEDVEPYSYLDDPIFTRSGAMAASMTMLVAFWRPLKEGEERASLLKKCIRALNPQLRGPLVQAHTCVTQAVEGMAVAKRPADAGSSSSSAAPANASAATELPPAKKQKTDH